MPSLVHSGLFYSLSPSHSFTVLFTLRRLSHCAVRVALIWFLARLALCFAFGVSFAVISPLSCSLSLHRIQPLRIARKSLWLIVVIDGRVCLPLSPALSHSASLWLWATHIMVALCFRFPKGTLLVTVEAAVPETNHTTYVCLAFLTILDF